MPLVYQQDINLNTKMGIWHIAEEEDYFVKEYLKTEIAHPHKRIQTLAGRHLLKILFPEIPLELIEVAPTKKPFIPNDPYHFSISHCGDYAAAIVSTSHRVGVDVEMPQQKIIVLQKKFLSEAEQKIMLSAELPYEIVYTIAWSVKEAVFKWYGKGQLNFIDHMEIVSFDISKDEFKVKVNFKKEEERRLYLKGRIHFNLCSVFLCT